MLGIGRRCDLWRRPLSADKPAAVRAPQTRSCPERDQRIRELRAKNWPASKIGRELGVSQGHVEFRLRALKIRCSHYNSRSPVDSPWNDLKIKNEVVRLHAEGVVIAAIGRRLGLTKNQIIGFCHRNGLTRKNTQPYYVPQRDYFGDKPGCLYPYGEIGRPNFHFCGAIPHSWLSRTGKLVLSPYCRVHHKITHLPPNALTKLEVA